MEAAVQFADNSPDPALESLYEELYVVSETMGWYAVDERSPEPHPGELGEEAPAAARDLAESVADRESEIEPQNRPGVRD